MCLQREVRPLKGEVVEITEKIKSWIGIEGIGVSGSKDLECF